MSERQSHSRDGRLRIAPPCEFGHSWQAMECPSCAERTSGETPSAEWRAWYRRRYGKKADQREADRG